MKNPFKKSSIADTLINVGIGGGANVAMDYIFDSVEALASIASYKNIIKIGVGALAGSMVTNKWARAAADGIATVGVSNLIQEYMDGSEEPANNGGEEDATKTPGGLPNGTIGRPMYLGQKNFKNMRVAGASFMES